MVCLECGKECKQLSYRHLKSCSGLTPTQYKEKHKIEFLSDPDVRSKSSLAREKNPNYKDGRTFNDCFCKVCGVKIYPRKEAMHCKKCRENPNGFTRNSTHTDSTKEKMKAAAQLRDKSTYKFGVADPAHLSKMQKQYWSKLTLIEKYERLSNFIKAGQKYNKKNKNTKIEQIARSYLDRHNILYIQTYAIPGSSYVVDFLLEDNVVLECYGDYWHCHPDIYEEMDFHENMKMKAGDIWIHDSRRVRIISDLGYDVRIVWECNLLSDPERTLDLVLFDKLKSK